MITVASWNVLHRVHAENWAEPVIEQHPDEHARIEAIAARVERALLVDRTIDAIALQEVSGDQLAALRARIGDRATILAHQYRRTPKWKRSTTTVLADATEHLVTIARDEAQLIAGHTFERDDGKGYLAIVLAQTGMFVVNTHITYGDPAAAQIAALATIARTHAGPSVITGDFNADRARVLGEFGAGFAIIDPPDGSLPTRPRPDPTKKSMAIDHVVVHRTSGDNAQVLSADGLSDHNVVLARIL